MDRTIENCANFQKKNIVYKTYVAGEWIVGRSAPYRGEPENDLCALKHIVFIEPPTPSPESEDY